MAGAGCGPARVVLPAGGLRWLGEPRELGARLERPEGRAGRARRERRVRVLPGPLRRGRALLLRAPRGGPREPRRPATGAAAGVHLALRPHGDEGGLWEAAAGRGRRDAEED